MSQILKLAVSTDLKECLSTDDLQCVVKKYSKTFTNAIDASEFNQMVKEAKMQIEHT